MADCPNCGTEVRPEWSLCPHCKVNMRTYAGPHGGYVHPVTPVQAAPAPAAPTPTAPAPAVSVSPAPAPAEEGAAVCPHCGAALPSPDTQYCPQCGDPILSTSPIARVRRILSNRYLVGALAVVFVLLLAGILLAGQGEAGATGTPAQAANVGPLPSPTVTTVMSRNTSSPTPVATGRGRVPGAANASGNVTPRVNETVAVVKTLDRYIQNAGGDIGNQLRTPAVPTTPTPPSSVPTSASGPVGDLSWSGEGTYVTEPFALEAGTIQVAMTAGVLTMAQLRDSAGTAIGITTAGPQPATTAIRVAVPGMYRLEIWPFGSGPWTVTISYAPIPTAVPTLPPVVVTTAAPTANVTPENSTTAVVTPVPTTLETLTTVTTEIPTETPTVTPVEAPAPMPTQERRSLQGDGSLETGRFTLYQGLASFTSATTANGTFSVTLVGSGETVLVAPVNGPFSGSKLVQVPATGSYLLNVTAGGPWEISIS